MALQEERLEVGHAPLTRRDFQELSRRVKAYADRQSWLHAHGSELAVFALRLGLFAAGYAVFARATFLARALGLIAMSYAYYGIGITGVHEASHRAFVAGAKGNRAWLAFFSDFWSAQSGDWWHHRHVILHHVHTNVVDRDPPLFVYPWLDKHLYFFVTPFLVSFWLVWHSAAHLRARGRGLASYLALAAAGWAFHIALFARLLPWGQAVAAAFVMRSLFAPVFMHLAVFNHIGLDFPAERGSWMKHQTRTTRNLKAHWFTTGMGGNAFVECHLEHHLFPSLSNRLLAEIMPLVRDYLTSTGYDYVEEGYWACLGRSLRHYDAFFADPAAV